MEWKCKNHKISFGDRVLVMGIVNVTPDSFSDGGEHFSPESAVECAIEMQADGADIIDIGAQSTRPGYNEISADEEWSRLEPVLTALSGRLNVPVSVDTYYPSVAEKALKAGVSIINDVSGIISPEMAEIVKNEGCGWIIMHNGSGTPDEIRQFFGNCAEKCKDFGIDTSQLCFDMGIGFGKSFDENMTLIANAGACGIDGFPLLMGASRKRVIGQGSGQKVAGERIYGNIAADTAAIMSRVDIIRLHDVKNEKQGILMAHSLKKYIRT